MQYFTIKTVNCYANQIAIPIKCKYVYQEPLENYKDAILAYPDCQIGKGEFVGMVCPQTDKCPFETIPKVLPYPY
ncbi:hypothetical protein [Clostridium sp. FP1]|uniref:hypothetical protein n=1 Tax=Clostridium sp. FP1 TaxID=2724076 RepID=UPI0013E96FA4|nr:hypothetical protein [Clostridium sp. FP1]MBZ9633148.1 hypothetical protein [Clostridium sp. FP1]